VVIVGHLGCRLDCLSCLAVQSAGIQ
jgi:hypothetical protein